MDKTAALIRRASEVRRRIFASLPWDVRFAEVITMLAVDAGMFNAWGKAIGAAFLNAGVEGMPDPGPLWAAHPGDPRRLPNGYMASFMSGVFKTCLDRRISGNDPVIVSAAIDWYLSRIFRGSIKIAPVVDPRSKSQLLSVESYVREGCKRACLSLRRKKLKEMALEESLESGPNEEDEGGVTKDIPDPKTIENPHFITQLKKYNPHMVKEWYDYLAKHLHEDAGQYIELLLDGYEQKEIVGSPKDGVNEDGTLKEPGMLTHYKPKSADPGNWFMMWKRNFGPLSETFFKSKGENLVELLSP